MVCVLDIGEAHAGDEAAPEMRAPRKLGQRGVDEQDRDHEAEQGRIVRRERRPVIRREAPEKHGDHLGDPWRYRVEEQATSKAYLHISTYY